MSSRTTRKQPASVRSRWLLRRVPPGALALAALAWSAGDGRGQDKPATQPAENASASAPDTAPAGVGASRYRRMSLEELMNVEVTSVTRRESTVLRSPAAVSVITDQEIRRSGATSIPEALRLAPGMEVARMDSSTWAISTRGFNSTSANKMLVLIDGRTVYSPLFSGTFWDVQDTLIQDIDRIEVIRGPAGAVWGANAVNGVINVITKSAKDTQGGLAVLGGGTEERLFARGRYGWEISDNAWAKVYLKHFERDETTFTNGEPGQDDWHQGQGGFRIDWEPSAEDRLTVHGDVYAGDRNNNPTTFNPTGGDTDLSGGNILALWSRDMGVSGDIQLQMYYDRTNRNIPGGFAENRDTFDIDFQHHFKLNDRNDVTWGLGYRMTADDVDNSFLLQFEPEARLTNLYSAFIQDEIQVVPDKLVLTLGAKFEHNDFSGFEVQPNARLLYTIDDRQVIWGAISRAVRTPTRLEDDLVINSGGFVVLGNRDFEAENVIAYEIGYRVQPQERISFDLTAFFNDYDNLQSAEFTGTSFVIGNGLHGETYGFEAAATWSVTDWWTVRASYAFLDVQLHLDDGSTDITTEVAEGNDPENQIMLRSSMDLTRHVQFDLTARYVDNLPNQGVPSYTAVDARLAWIPNDHLEFAIVGQNLFDTQHPEFGAGVGQHEIERSVYGMVTYRW